MLAKGRSLRRNEAKPVTPELELCVYCKKPIKPGDDYVPVEPAAQESHDFGKPIYQKYAHAECYEQMRTLEPD
jgi:hypothetical protein